MLEIACDANVTEEFADGEASQFEAMLANESEGVKNITWSREILDAYRGAWEEVLVEEIAANDDVKLLWNSYQSFHEKYKVWGERGYLK